MIQVFIADDHALIRSGMRQILQTAKDIEVAGEASRGEELLASLDDRKVHVLLLDLSMPGLSGPALVQAVHTKFPRVRILVVSMHKDGPVASRALQAGAIGYLTKDSEPEILLSSIRKVAAGQSVLDPDLVGRLATETPAMAENVPEGISRRELEVLQLISSGRSLNEIASLLCVSPKTVSTYKMRLMQKLDVDNNADLLRHAIQMAQRNG